MSILLITHALNDQAKNYAPFFEALKNNANYWWHYLDTTWIVSTHYSANDYAKLLYPYMNDTDRLLVVKIAKEYQGWLPTEAWDWLNNKQY